MYECEKEKIRMKDVSPSATRRHINALMTIVGLIASVSSIPQIIQIWETRTVAGISLITQIIAFVAVVAWFFYGLYIKNKPLAITSGVSVAVLGTVIVQIFVYS